MTVTFHIHYRTSQGQQLAVLSQPNAEVLLLLTSTDGEHWQGTYEIEQALETSTFAYRYAVVAGGDIVRREIGRIPHRISWTDTAVSVQDVWRDLPPLQYRFADIFNPTSIISYSYKRTKEPTIEIEVRALCPQLSSQGLVLGLSGNCGALGNWEERKAVEMQEIAPHVWSARLDIRSFPASFQYKFVAIDPATHTIRYWEKGDNRICHLPSSTPDTAVALPEATPIFTEMIAPRIAGSAIPVFSLRSEGSCGVGDLGDLKQYVDWALLTHQKAVQILPINDTTATHTFTDSYPYSAISIYALHPMYIDLRQLPLLTDEVYLQSYEQRRKALNALHSVDYEAVNVLKHEFLRKVYEQEAQRTFATVHYQDFFAENKEWLIPYAAYSYLSTLYGTHEFPRWETYAVYDKEAIAQLCAPTSSAYSHIAYYYFVQYHLHCQLLAISSYARMHQVLLKGDIPIGISRHSVEAWTEPYYFHMDGQAGAPPDAFSVNGQNWGFPTYNWERMAQDGYRWWRNRFMKMSTYFTAYRIDHILGFFRIWEIPNHCVHGLLGQFSPALPLSVAEIEQWGLSFQRNLMTEPFINEELLQNVFGDRAEEVKGRFFQHTHQDVYRFLPAFDTQRKVEAYFQAQGTTDELLKEKLYQLLSNVLFVADKHDADKFHPRITAETAPVFDRLNEVEKEAFRRLYQHYYYERHNDFWYQEAMRKLPMLIQSTDMLVCGEDLGMVPSCVPWLMRDLQILSLEIERMPKTLGVSLADVSAYPYLSVCTTGTHDMNTYRAWWEQERNQNIPSWYHETNAPQEATGSIVTSAIQAHLSSPSMLAIFPWQDLIGMDEELRCSDVDSERINVPADPQHYWRWRMHIPLDQLMREDRFNDHLRHLIDDSGR